MKKQTVSLAALSLIVNFSGDAQSPLEQDAPENRTPPPLYRTTRFSENRPEDFVTISALSEKGDFLEGLFAAVEAGYFLEENKERVHRHCSKVMTALKTETDHWEKQPFYRARETSKFYSAYRYWQVIQLRKKRRRKADLKLLALKRLESQGFDAPER